VGAAKAWVAHKAASPSADIQNLDGGFDIFINKLSRVLEGEREKREKRDKGKGKRDVELMLVFQ
jgi:hypothetical protein